MNLDSLSFTLSQISYLVASLTKKKYSQVIEDLTKVSKIHSILLIKNFRKFRKRQNGIGTSAIFVSINSKVGIKYAIKF